MAQRVEQRAEPSRTDATAQGGKGGASVAPPASGLAFVDSLGRDGELAPASVERALRSPGAPLDDSLRAAAEQRLGARLGEVYVHRDRSAAESAREIRARAYSVGAHVVFGEGHYAPHTARGRETLMHELAHVAQRGPGASLPSGPLMLGARDSFHERAARAAARPGGSMRLGGPRLPDHVVARDVEDDSLDALAVEALRRAAEARQPAPPDNLAIVKEPKLFVVAQESSGLTAQELTLKRNDQPRSYAEADPRAGRAGEIRSRENTHSRLVNEAGAVVVSRDIDTDKRSRGVTYANKDAGSLPGGTAVANRDEESFSGESEKTTRTRTQNAAATSDSTAFKTFQGGKHTVNGTIPGTQEFREEELIVGRESRRVHAEVESRDTNKRVVARERSLRDTTADGVSKVDLRNTGTKYQGLDLTRKETLRGARVDSLERAVEHADGASQRERTATTQRGTVELEERTLRLGKPSDTAVDRRLRLDGLWDRRKGLELRKTRQAVTGETSSTRVTELSRDGGAGPAFSGKASAEYSRGRRVNTTFTVNKPGASPIAPRVIDGAKVTGGRLGLVTPTAPDSRAVIVGDKAAYEDPANAGKAGSYTETIAFGNGVRDVVADDYEVTDRGASANVTREVERGALHSVLRKDRFNLGWLVVENALTTYAFAGAKGRAAAGVKGGVDANNLNASLGGSVGATWRGSDEVTVRLGGFFARIKGEADTFAGIEASLSGEVGHTRGAGAGVGVNASAFAGSRVGAGGKIDGGFQNVAFAAGAYKLRGSVGAGFKANFEARLQNGYLLLSGGVALAAELGVGADVELRINPGAAAAAVLKGLAALPDVRHLNARKAIGGALSRGSELAQGAYHGAGDLLRGAYGRARGLFR